MSVADVRVQSVRLFWILAIANPYIHINGVTFSLELAGVPMTRPEKS